MLVVLAAMLVFAAVVSVTADAASPNGKAAGTWGAIKSGNGVRAAPPAIAMGEFVNIPLYSSPPWYPPEEETDRYRWEKRLHWASDDLPVDTDVYTVGAPGGAFGAVTPAFEEWDGYTSATIYGTTVEDAETTPPGAVRDGSNTVSWGIIDGPGDIIALCRYWYWVNTKELIEFDIVFDAGDPWSTIGAEDAFDVLNVMTHELGHTLVLGDLRSPKDGALTMHAYTWPGDTVKRDLGSGDILGIQKIYGE